MKWGKDSLFNKRETLNDSYLTPYIKINLKWTIDLTVIFRKRIMKFQENVGEYLHDFGIGKDFLNQDS